MNPETKNKPVIKPWGGYTVLTSESNHKVKRIYIELDRYIDLQHHKDHDKHWIILRGVGAVICGREPLDYNDTFIVKPGYRVKIPAGHTYRIQALGDKPLVFIEVQVEV
jgi:mannose-6-phosphate isomerase-like protein (cupin superfamily)